MTGAAGGGTAGSIAINRSIGDGGEGHAGGGWLILVTVVEVGCCASPCCVGPRHRYKSVIRSRCSSCDAAVGGTPSAFLIVAMSCCVASAM